MREYNLFCIKKEYYDLYKKKPYLLFDILNNIKNTNNSYGFFLYEQICNRIDINILNDYLNDKFKINKKYIFYIDEVTIKLKFSRIIVESRYNFPNIIKFFNYYNRYLFVVDFNNNDYFWLNDFAHEKILIKT